ncbi:MAG TPA: GGDEF domain-containing protein [Terriglobales bacterium]|nr:GGDEF domain-containing protein [Terriglobales bacterium]
MNMAQSGLPNSCPPEMFVVEVFSELKQETIQRRWREVSVLLRLSMLAGLPMQLDASLNMLCDFAAEVTSFDKALVYFWEEDTEQVALRVARGMKGRVPEPIDRGNVLNLWAAQYNRPLLVTRGYNLQADALFDVMRASSALIVPLMVSNRVLGSLQLFSSDPNLFIREDAQLLWVMSLLAETVLTREYANEGLITFAFTDFLTGLKTRGYFEQQLELEIKRFERKRIGFALVMLDIDHFKQLNDRYGHHVGDQVLRDVASILMKDMRDIDTVARYGGEEFVMILPETSGPKALRVAHRLRSTVENARFPAAAEQLTISAGVAVFNADAQSKRELIECADAALYQAKSQGRNQVLLHSEIAGSNRKIS